MSLPVNWPEHVVHEDDIHQVLGHASADPRALHPDDHLRITRLRDLIARATTSGRIKRLVIKDAETDEVLGRGYYRDDLHRIAGIGPRRLQVPLPAEPVRIQAKPWAPAASSLR
ncbi:MAG TPA: hypothetical protein VFS62_14230 [Chloroflexota bacterium]|nr:hypothetical protein [Chloroflexota bacterium]